MANIDAVVRALVEGKPVGPGRLNPRIRISYEIVTPESAAEGDFADSGWVDEEGVSMVPDEYDLDDGLTVVTKAIKFLKDEGVLDGSGSSFDPGMWYMTEPQTTDYATGAEESRQYHLVDFTEEQEKEVFDGIVFVGLPRSKGPTPEEFE